MLIAERNRYRIMTPLAFRLVPYKPCFHYAILSAMGYDLPGKIKAPTIAHATKPGRLSFLVWLFTPVAIPSSSSVKRKWSGTPLHLARSSQEAN